jgi:hypothetical protein
VDPDISPPISLLLAIICNSGWTAAASKTFMKDGAPFAIQRMAKNGWTPDPTLDVDASSWRSATSGSNRAARRAGA